MLPERLLLGSSIEAAPHNRRRPFSAGDLHSTPVGRSPPCVLTIRTIMSVPNLPNGMMGLSAFGPDSKQQGLALPALCLKSNRAEPASFEPRPEARRDTLSPCNRLDTDFLALLAHGAAAAGVVGGYSPIRPRPLHVLCAQIAVLCHFFAHWVDKMVSSLIKTVSQWSAQMNTRF